MHDITSAQKAVDLARPKGLKYMHVSDHLKIVLFSDEVLFKV